MKSMTVLLSLGLLCAPLWAEEENARIEAPGIVYSDDDGKAFRVGEIARLGISGLRLANNGGGENLRVRIFHGTRRDLLNRPRHLRDGCLLYFSMVLPVRETARSLSVETPEHKPLVFTTGWLSRDLRSRGQDQWYVLVLERGPAGPSTRETLRLHPDEAAGYFRQGFQFVVRSQRGVNDTESAMLASLDEEEQTENRRAARILSHINCLQYREVSLAAGGTLTPCSCSGPVLARTEAVQAAQTVTDDG